VRRRESELLNPIGV